MKTFTLIAVACLACFGSFAQQAVRTFDTLDALLSADLRTITSGSKATVDVLGKRSKGDWGNRRTAEISTNITLPTNLGNVFTNTVISNRVYQITFLDRGSARQDIRWFGAIPDDGLDDVQAINATLEFANSQGRRVVEVPPGDFHQSTSIVMQTRVRLIGTGSSTKGDNEVQSPTNAAGASLGPSRLIVLNAANCTQIVTGPTNGLYVRQPNEWNEDGSTNNSVEYNWGIENLVLYGNGSNQTRYDCHGIKLDYGWNFYIRNVQFVYHRGYKIWAVDLNQINVDNVGGLGAVDIVTSKPWSKGYLFWGTADSLIREIGGGFVGGPGIWLTGSSSWQNHIEGCFIYNCLRQEFAVTAVSTSTGQIDLAEDHVYETGMPAEIWAVNGGVNPTGINPRQPYWVIKVDSDSIKLAATRPNAEAGIAVIPTTTGSGLRVWHGPGSGIYANWGASQNTVVGGRYDQNEDSGIILHDTARMAVVGNNITFNGFQTLLATNAAQPAAGVELSGYCYAPVITGNVFNRLTPWYRQDYGIWVRTNAWVATVLSSTQRPIISGNSGQVSGTNYYAESTADNLIPLWHADGPVHIGRTNSGSGLIVTGNSGGVPTLRLVRNSSGIVADMGIGVGDGSFNFSDWKVFKTLFLVDGNDPTKVSVFLGANTAQASPRDVTIYSESGTGTDVSAGDIELRTGAGTGAGTMPKVSFLTSTPATSGATAQVVQTAGWFDTNGLTVLNGKGITLGAVKRTAWPTDASAVVAGNGLTNSAGVLHTALDSGDNLTLTTNAQGRIRADVTGTLPTARLGTGTSTTNTFLQGQGSGVSAAWTTIPSTPSPTNGIADAPADGVQYARLNNAWTGIDVAYLAGLSAFGSNFITGGDVGGIGITQLATDSVGNAAIRDQAVNYANIQDVTADRILGRSGPSAGSIQEIALGSSLYLDGLTLEAEPPVNSLGTNKLTVAAFLALINRGNHTGEQAISTVTGLQTALDGKQPSDPTLLQLATITLAAGDLLWFDGVNLTNLTKSSTNGTVLTLESGNPRWVTPSPAASSFGVVYVGLPTEHAASPTNEATIITTRSGASKALTGLTDGDVLKLELAGTFDSSASNWSGDRMRIKFGGVVLEFWIREADSVVPTGFQWSATAYLTVVTAGSSATFKVTGWMDHQYEPPPPGSDYPRPFRIPAIVTGSLDTTGSVVVDATWEGRDQPMAITCNQAILTRY